MSRALEAMWDVVDSYEGKDNPFDIYDLEEHLIYVLQEYGGDLDLLPEEEVRRIFQVAADHYVDFAWVALMEEGSDGLVF